MSPGRRRALPEVDDDSELDGFEPEEPVVATGRRGRRRARKDAVADDEAHLDDLDDDVIYVHDEPGATHRAWAVAAFMLLFVFGALGLGVYYLQSQINPPAAADAGPEITVDIPNDSSMTTIARLLEEKGVVTNGTIFRFYVEYKDAATSIRPGHYDKLRKRQPMDEVIARLQEGPVPPRYVDFLVPEGKWVPEVMDLVKAKFPNMGDTELAQATQTVRSPRFQPPGAPLDGLLFPATYRVLERDAENEVALIQQMVSKFDAVGEQIGLADVSGLQGAAGSTTITPYDVIKVASLVEAEAKLDEDRPRIARVIYNRLAKNMKLQIDATVLAAQRQRKDRVLNSDLEFDSPYNTYRNAGLPPTPISQPGEASLRAALDPSNEPGAEGWIYYVLSDADGRHTFTSNDRDHQNAVAEARRKGLL